MSGIVGFISKREEKTTIIKQMNNAILHRGSDEEDYFIDNTIALGYRLLQTKKQPIKIDDYVVMIDGNILNIKELQEELGLKTNNEVAILVEGYKTWKEQLPHKLRGAFSFVIWNTKNNILFGARDPFGLKPFYYYAKNHSFVFASEIKAILKYPDYIKELNKDIINLYLIYNFNPSNETFFKEINALAPGTFFIYDNEELQTHKYYTYEFIEEESNEEDTINKIEEVISNSVSLHLEEDDYGSLLSSGIDSSYLVCLANPKKTYTVGYNEGEYSEISYAKDLSDKLGITNISRIISKEEYLSVVPMLMYHLDEPIADPGAIALYFVLLTASKDYKVVTSGEGADEFFGGYNIYQDIYKFTLYNKIPFFIRRLISKFISIFPEFKGRDFLIRRGQKTEEYYVGLNWIFKENEIGKYLNYQNNSSLKSILNDIYKDYENQNDLVKMQAVDINLSLIKNFLVNGDKIGMAVGVDVRTPFTDIKVFDIARKLTTNAKVTKTDTKVYLRKAAKRIIPNESYKKKKLGFPVPLREWMREDLYYEKIQEAFNSEIAKEFFKQKNIIKLLEEHKSGKKDNYKKIWTIYCFLVWYQEYFK